jgi:Mannosyl-glycoprotein endo-beta-N-acetylglucosaminidase
MSPGLSPTARLLGALLAALVGGVVPAAARGPVLPDIRLSSGQTVPACVTPRRLMHHVLERTVDLRPAFGDIARYYKQHGEALRVRWDYAFFQMLLETNYLSYRTGNGGWGDVDPRQNNFAGIGTTGGGVPGDSFPDVSTGVLAQMQHLIAYSGERVRSPLAPRTREKQDDIIERSLALGRPVRFDDLTNRWAADRNYARSIEWVAERYRHANCTPSGEPLHATADDAVEARSREMQLATGGAPSFASAPQTTPTAAVPHPPACDVYSASYGGQVALLIRSVSGASVNYTVLQVNADLEQPQADAFIAAHAPNGRTIARFPSPEPAFVRAFELCPRR